VGELIKKGVLTVGDMNAFEQYCTLVGSVAEYEELITTVGLEQAHALGYANYLLKLRTQCRQAAAHLGLTPSSRSGVKAVKVVAPKSAAEKRRTRFFGAEKGAS
jgi:P27 family predicted phage terminase small subunit